MIAIDLGSSSLRIIEYACLEGVIVNTFEATVKMAEGLRESGHISKGAIDRVVMALQKAQHHFDFTKSKVIAVTTEAMRQATNASEVLDEIRAKTGIAFNIITAEDEARYTALGVTTRLKKLETQALSYLLFDLGGASTEIIYVKEGELTAAAVSIDQETLATHLEPTLEAISSYIATLYLQEGKPPLFVATAGTPTTMAAYLNGMDYSSYDSSKINGYRLHVDSCDRVLNDLLAMSESQRSFYVGIGREELIIAGIEIVKMLYEIAGYQEAVVIDDGLREGVAISGCNSGGKSG